ncbi:unnamed protein product [Hymenolepis diminuta]|uniref:Uncharacterized protein n=1 Tax=Hymenolepis diminuta TaxID=6216 RepID=A0A0R3SCZ5_HYMDI|nr:unnamed protein product [Hymenolepis diminuta]VUZ45902.1 unnamed protein product [Hymenolepis diminuta]
MLPREGDVYGGFPQTVILASSTLPGGRKVPIIATSGDGAPIGYMVTSNPATIDSKFMNYETATLKQNRHPLQPQHQQSQQQPMCADDTSSSSIDNPKTAYSGLLYRIPDGSSVTVEKNYMTINPELFQQSIYHRLQVPGEWNEANTEETECGSKKKVVVMAHEKLPVRWSDTERKKIPKDDSKIKKRCRFSNTQEMAEVTLFSQPNNSRRSSTK